MQACDKILIVEDDPDDRFLLTSALHSNGVTHVDEVTSGEEAVEYVSRLQEGQQPKLIIVDLTLKTMSGLDLIRWLRQHSIFDDVPIVILSGSREEEHQATAIALRAKAYYVKPSHDSELDTIVKDALEHCREGHFLVAANVS